MQTMRGEFFIKKDFGFYDSGAIAVVGMIPLYVYELLRRFVWRSIETGDPEMRLMYREGYLAAKVTQNTVAELLGIEARQTICKHLGALKRLGWVRAVSLKNSSIKAYVLGEVTFDRMGRRHEVFFADAWMRDLWDALTVAAEERAGAGAQPTALPVEDRIELVRAFVERYAQSAEGEDEVVPSTGGVNSNDTPVTLARQGVSLYDDRVCRPRVTLEEGSIPKAENDIETRGLRLSAQGLGGTPESRVGEQDEFFSSGSSTQPTQRTTPPGSREKRSAESFEYNAPKPTGRYGNVNLDELIAQNRQAQVQRLTQIAEEASKRGAKLDNLKGKAQPVKLRAALIELEGLWRELMGRRFPDIMQPRWDGKGKEPNQLKQLVEKYDVAVIRDALTYVVERWDVLRERIFKGQGSVPTIGMILKLHDSLVLEAQQYANAMRAVQAVREITDKDPFADVPPELDEKARRARKDLEALGVKLG